MESFTVFHNFINAKFLRFFHHYFTTEFLRFFAIAKNASLREQGKTLRASFSLRRDKTLKVIYNASAYREEKDEEVRAFLKYVYTNDPGKDVFSSRLSAIVEDIKLNDIFRSQYAAMNLHDKDLIRWAKKEALAEGIQKKAVEDARSFFANGTSIELIAKSLNMSESKIRELTRDIVPEKKQTQCE